MTEYLEIDKKFVDTFLLCEITPERLLRFLKLAFHAGLKISPECVFDLEQQFLRRANQIEENIQKYSDHFPKERVSLMYKEINTLRNKASGMRKTFWDIYS